MDASERWAKLSALSDRKLDELVHQAHTYTTPHAAGHPHIALYHVRKGSTWYS